MLEVPAKGGERLHPPARLRGGAPAAALSPERQRPSRSSRHTGHNVDGSAALLDPWARGPVHRTVACPDRSALRRRGEIGVTRNGYPHAQASLWRRVRRQPRNVFGLGGASLLNDTASEMIYPLLPAFLTGTLGAAVPVLGLIEGLAESLNSLVKLGFGAWSDRLRRRKPLVLLGYGVASVARPLIALAAAPWHVLLIRAADRVGKGVRSAPRDALLAHSVPPSARGLAFATQRALDHTGALLGPLLATLLLLALTSDLRVVFGLAALPAAGTLLLLWRTVREVPVAAHPPGGSPAAAPDPHARARSAPDPTRPVPPDMPASASPADPAAAGPDTLSRGTGRLLFVFFLFTLGNSTDAFLLLRAQRLGVSAALLPLLWAAFHLSKVAWSLPGGDAADRLGPRRVIAAGWTVYALVYLGFALASEPWHAWALFLLYGLHFGLSEGPERALIASFARPAELGRVMGGYHLAVGVAAFPASLGFGFLWERFGAPAAFCVGAAIALAATVFLLWLPEASTPAPGLRARPDPHAPATR
ncbi:MAG: MFS transporter [Gemmatimonadetes bacterium]|nr:MFS transporter [Gemmatimonadota bacterium]